MVRVSVHARTHMLHSKWKRMPFMYCAVVDRRKLVLICIEKPLETHSSRKQSKPVMEIHSFHSSCVFFNYQTVIKYQPRLYGMTYWVLSPIYSILAALISSCHLDALFGCCFYFFSFRGFGAATTMNNNASLKANSISISFEAFAFFACLFARWFAIWEFWEPENV